MSVITLEPPVIELPEVTDDPIIEVLEDMADMLQRDGWQQGEIGSREGPKCLVGAATYAIVGPDGSGGVELYDGVKAALRDVIGQHDLAIWNDRDGRTRHDVLTLIWTAIERRRAARREH